MEAGLHFCSMYVGRTGNHLIIYYLKRRENEEMDHKKKNKYCLKFSITLPLFLPEAINNLVLSLG
jgi:hypothetical protein